MLYIIGLGLSDLEDITLKGLNAIQSSSKVYLEYYTSVLSGCDNYKETLESFYKKPVVLADRFMVEQNADEIIESSKSQVVSFLVVGDPFGATTHTDLVLRAIERGVSCKIIHNASIMNAIGCCGLQLYSFGETVSICFWSEGWRPKSYFGKICENRVRGLHTLCLLDIKVKEKSVENLIKGRDIYEPARFMSVAQACQQLLSIVDELETVFSFSSRVNKESNQASPIMVMANQVERADRADRTDLAEQVEETEIENYNDYGVVLDEQKEMTLKAKLNSIGKHTLCVGLARVGKDDQKIIVDTLERMAECDLGSPLHSLIVVGRLHPIEAEFLKLFYGSLNDESSKTQNNCEFANLIEQHNKYYLK
jgi:diphthine methyl ester synthase